MEKPIQGNVARRLAVGKNTESGDTWNPAGGGAAPALVTVTAATS